MVTVRMIHNPYAQRRLKFAYDEGVEAKWQGRDRVLANYYEAGSDARVAFNQGYRDGPSLHQELQP